GPAFPQKRLQPLHLILPASAGQSFSFTPSDLRLTAGKKVVLHFANQGSGGHNFSAPDFFAAATIDPTSARLVVKGKVELKKGTSADVILTPKAGHYSVKCTHFLHSGFGMKGEIVVE
ncbi:plastocyanin/azurin family copper-binding protein, partial [Rhizorhapis sp. SPR117]|uniref:plastocyanin/azurin family copper-binding protein n=1 Tax=Rhizorhapis sp. SPR117 TaxID=2912611 RepID=UPI001F3DA072|nr:cupredoxin domain-containing protein [Rhizorhapis sp. SPR117]